MTLVHSRCTIYRQSSPVYEYRATPALAIAGLVDAERERNEPMPDELPSRTRPEEPMLWFNGLDGRSGGYLTPPVPRPARGGSASSANSWTTTAIRRGRPRSRSSPATAPASRRPQDVVERDRGAVLSLRDPPRRAVGLQLPAPAAHFIGPYVKSAGPPQAPMSLRDPFGSLNSESGMPALIAAEPAAGQQEFPSGSGPPDPTISSPLSP